MAKKKVVICFDYENDKNYRNTLKMWDANSNFEFSFADLTPQEIKSNDISIIKAVLSRKIKEATYTLVIVGKYSNSRHRDYQEIGYKNWQNFEIVKSKEYNNKLVAVKIDRSYESPDELYNSGASWAMSFTQDAIIRALKGD
jgi:hypothetical protein